LYYIYGIIAIKKYEGGLIMAFKYENGKVIQVSPPKITGKDAKKMLNAEVPKAFVEKILRKKFITVKAS